MSFFKWVLIFYPIFFTSIEVFSQGEIQKTGARSAGLAHASATLSDEWALFNNISGIAGLINPTVSLSYQNRWNITGFNTAYLGFVYPTKFGVPGVSISRFGDQYYNEHVVGLGCGHKIRNVSLGVKVNYLQIVMEEISTKRNIIFEFGGIAEITSKLIFGAHIYNLNQSRIKSQEGNFYLPVVMKAGLSYRPSKEVIINAETEKNISYKQSYRAGIEYALIPKLKLRTGISTFPFVNYFGTGFQHKNFQIDYSLNFHKALGVAQQLSLSYKFKSK